jgi:hypothetical protein
VTLERFAYAKNCQVCFGASLFIQRTSSIQICCLLFNFSMLFTEARRCFCRRNVFAFSGVSLSPFLFGSGFQLSHFPSQIIATWNLAFIIPGIHCSVGALFRLKQVGSMTMHLQNFDRYQRVLLSR